MISPVASAVIALSGFSAQSTAYCLNGRTASGLPTHNGSVAMNTLPLGSRIRVSTSPTGRKTWVVTDRIGWGSQLDFWVPRCGIAYQWGRRTVRVTVLRRGGR